MFNSFFSDRYFIERKYHDPNKPFDPYKRRAYNGWDCPKETGLSTDEIIAGLKIISDKFKDCSHEVQKARAIEFVLQNTKIDISEYDFFPVIYTWDREIAFTTINKWEKEVFEDIIPDIKEKYDLFNLSGASNIWPDFDHVVPDWQSVLSLGFFGIKERAKSYREKLSKKAPLSPEQIAYFDGIDIEYSAILEFLDRFYRLSLNKNDKKSALIQEAFFNIKNGAPTNFFEALLTIYLYFMISESVDHYQVRSLGNGLDNTLFKFYKNDIDSKKFTRQEIKTLLAYFFMQWSAIGNYWGQPFYLGGSNLDGTCKINDLSYDIVEVYSSLQIYNPKIQIKYNDNLPIDFLNIILCQIRKNNGSFVFCCEPGMIKAVQNYGATFNEAFDFDIRGCYETGVRANEVSSAGAYINTLKAVEYLFSNGFDKRINKQVGIKTGAVADFKNFDEFYGAFIKQWEYLIESSIEIVGAYEKYLGFINPSSMYSATIEHSLNLGKDAYQDGAKFNNSAELCCAFASTVDSLSVVKDLVFDKRVTDLTELKNALDNNWVGYEKLLLKAKKSTHKYGNGDDFADSLAVKMAKFYTDKVANRPNSRGGVYKPILHTAMQFVWQGEKTSATPDGRKAGEETSKNASPSVGADINGATALISSAVKLVPPNFTESFCLDIMLHPSAVSGNDGLVAMKGLLDVYLKNDGMSLQFNVFNADTLRDAQVHPEKYQNLQVRVCGWNVLFNNLSKKEQDAYILRAESVN